jgi:hypothetical protein
MLLSCHISGAGWTTDTGYDFLFYYENELDKGNADKSNFRINSDLKLWLRIRVKNIQKGVEHIKQCSDEIRKIFTHDDNGCSNLYDDSIGDWIKLLRFPYHLTPTFSLFVNGQSKIQLDTLSPQ